MDNRAQFDWAGHQTGTDAAFNLVWRLEMQYRGDLQQLWPGLWLREQEDTSDGVYLINSSYDF